MSQQPIQHTHTHSIRSRRAFQWRPLRRVTTRSLLMWPPRADRAAGRQRRDRRNGCDEIFFGFQLVAVAIHQSGYSRSEDGKFGGVRGRSSGRGATILRLHCRHRNGRSRVSNWRKLQRRRVGRDASIYYRECASFWIHDWQCIERIAGGFDCRAIYADEPDRPIAIRESGCSPGRISGIRAGFDSSFKYHRGFFGIHLRVQDE